MILAPSLAGCGLPKDTPAFRVHPTQRVQFCEAFCAKERSSTGGASDIGVGSLAQDCRLVRAFRGLGRGLLPFPS